MNLPVLFKKPAPTPPPVPPAPDPRPPVNIEPAPLYTDPARAQLLSQTVTVLRTDSQVLQQQVNKAGIGFRTSYGPLREIVVKSGYVKGLIQQRKSAVLHRNMYWSDKDDSEEAQYCASFQEEADAALDQRSAQFGGLLGDMHQALDANLYPFCVMRVRYDYCELAPMTEERVRRRPKSYLVPVNVSQFDLDRTGFDPAGRLCINARLPAGADPGNFGLLGQVPGAPEWYYADPWCWIVLNHYSYADMPHGGGMSPLESAYISEWMWRLARVFHLNFIERNTSPPFVAERDRDVFLSDSHEAEVKQAVDDVQQMTSFMLPAGVKVSWKELLSNASADALEAFMRERRYETAAAILGQSSTSMTERSGSQSSAEVQERVADSIVAVDALMLEYFRNQLRDRTLALNLPHLRHHWPRFRVQIASAQDLEKRLAQFKGATELGVPPTEEQMRRELGLDTPRKGQVVAEIVPAAYSDAAGQPSQQKGAKTKAKAAERDRKKPSQSEAQPRSQS